MRCCNEKLNGEDLDAREKSKEIDRSLRLEKRREDKKIKLLLLGMENRSQQ
jgi:hypothetical protein